MFPPDVPVGAEFSGRAESLRTFLRGLALLLMAFGLAVGVGCRSPRAHRESADRAAYGIVEEGQRAALGRVEPFSIETPEITLRRRLLQEQGLPVARPASLGAEDVAVPEHWPSDPYLERDRAVGDPDREARLEEQLTVTLEDALQLAARNSRDYQNQKESVFLAALDLDLERDAFRSTFAGVLTGAGSVDLDGTDGNGNTETVRGVTGSGDFSYSRLFENGLSFTTGLALDLTKLLSQGDESSFGILADVSVSVPLLAGAGRHIVTEPLKLAERSVLYSLWTFDRFRREFAVRIASDYLAVLQQLDAITNAEANYIRLIEREIESRARLEADRLSQIELDQVTQDVLRARSNWIGARERYSRALDRFKITLGFPTDARLELDRDDLTRLADRGRDRIGATLEKGDTSSDYRIETVDGSQIIIPVETDRSVVGPLELEPRTAMELAFTNRQDLKVSHGRVADAMRGVVVDADALRAGLNLVLNGSAGERRSLGGATLSDAELRPERGNYSAGLDFAFPWEKTAERNRYRAGLIDLERQVRDFQDLEDQIKLQIRDALGSLKQAREDIRIQFLALFVAQRRVDSTKDFFEAGRPGIQIRDILEAEDDLVSAQNALTAALVDYRVRELELQRDMGVLEIGADGMWTEFRPQDLGGKTDDNAGGNR